MAEEEEQKEEKREVYPKTIIDYTDVNNKKSVMLVIVSKDGEVSRTHAKGDKALKELKKLVDAL